MKNRFLFFLMPIVALLTLVACGDEGEEDSVLTIDTKTLLANSEGGSILLGVTSNISWGAVSSTDWCVLENYSNKGDGSIIVKVAANTSTSEREAVITVKGGSLSCVAVVKQSGTDGNTNGENGENGNSESDSDPSTGDDEDANDSDDTQGYNLSESGKEGGYSYVDLGLSVRWATYNVGATKLTGYGDHFAWGETTPKDDYSWSTYKWGSNYDELTKYNTEESYGIVDNKTQLDPEDDAAAANWKGKWRMPTVSELQELIDGCKWEWTDDMNGSGIAGRVGVSKKNGKAIFLPAAGYGRDGYRNYGDHYGNYWSSSLDSNGPYLAGRLLFYSGYIGVSYGDPRCNGYSVRAVFPSAKK